MGDLSVLWKESLKDFPNHKNLSDAVQMQGQQLQERVYGERMIWNEEISFDGFQKKIDEWHNDKDFELCDPPISAQFALDLIFKTLVDDREDYPYLTTMSESVEQTNSIMLDLILRKYSRKYRKYLKSKRKMVSK